MAKKGRYVYEWPRPMVTVDMAVFGFFAGRAKVLLISRGRDPFKGSWALPGGFIEIDEELVDAAARELAEETGLFDVDLEQLGAFGRCGRDPRGRVISVVYLGIAKKTRLKAGDDAAAAKWFDIEKLPAELAFDHDHVVNVAIRKLKSKKMYRTNRASAAG
jgi:8-oxo-dGTP diphosphatase